MVDKLKENMYHVSLKVPGRLFKDFLIWKRGAEGCLTQWYSAVKTTFTHIKMYLSYVCKDEFYLSNAEIFSDFSFNLSPSCLGVQTECHAKCKMAVALALLVAVNCSAVIQ